MLAHFYIPRLSNDMKVAVQKNHLGGQILCRILDPSKKTASKNTYILFASFLVRFGHNIPPLAAGSSISSHGAKKGVKSEEKKIKNIFFLKIENNLLS